MFRELAATMGELVVHVGIMQSVVHTWPEEVQANWHERVKRLITQAEAEIVEIQQFAEHYDGP